MADKSPRKLGLGQVAVIAALVIVSLAAALALAWATKWGAWAYSDSAAYVASARSLARGEGLGFVYPDGSFRPLRLHAPLFPVVLGAADWIGLDPIGFARWLDIGLFAMLVLITGVGVGWFTRQGLAGLAAAVMAAAALPMIEDYSRIMSEPLSITLGMAGLFLLAAHLHRPARARLIFAAILAGLALLARYASAAYLGAGVVSLVLFGARDWKQRLKEAAAFAVIGGLPILAWEGFVRLRYHDLAARGLQSGAGRDLALADFFASLRDVITGWIPFYTSFSQGVPALLAGAFALVLIVAAAWALRSVLQGPQAAPADRAAVSGPAKLAGVMIVFALVYIGVVLAGYLFSSPRPDIDSRTLSPLWPVGITILILAFFIVFRAVPARLRAGGYAFAMAAAGLLVVTAAWNIWQARKLLVPMHENGIGYTNRAFYPQTIFKAISDLPTGTPLLSNDPALVLFYLDRYPADAAALLQAGLPVCQAGQARSGLDKQCAMLKDGAALVTFKPLISTYFDPGADAWLDKVGQGLEPVYQGEEGRIFFWGDP